MKSIMFLALALVLAGSMNAQILRTTRPPAQNQVLRPSKATTKPTAPTTPSQQQSSPATAETPENPAPATVYYLVGAKLLVKTGNDSKEAPSGVGFHLSRTSKSVYSIDNNRNTTLLFSNNPDVSEKKEYLSQSNMSISLTPIYSMSYRYDEIIFKKIEDSGLKLEIIYHPNFFADAWKIELITLILEIRDYNGNPHPTLNYKAIPFIHANKLLTEGNNRLVLETDGLLFPKL